MLRCRVGRRIARGRSRRHLCHGNIGCIDEIVLETARSGSRVLLTEDRDFGELVYRLRKPAFGIVLLRFAIENRHLKVPRVSALLAKYADRLPRHFVVVDETKFRFRPLLVG